MRPAPSGAARAGAVTFIEDASLYASPARAIEAYRQQFERHVAAGAEQIRIAGDVPHEGNGGRFAGWDRYESAVNVVWQDYPVWSRCLYDATTVPDDVRDVVERTHRRLVTADGGATASPRYQDVAEFESLPQAADPLEATQTDHEAGRRLAEEDQAPRRGGRARADRRRRVRRPDVRAVRSGDQRAAVWTTARDGQGLDGAGPDRRARARRRPRPARPPDRSRPRPEGSSGAGLGLWLSHQLTDIDIALAAGADGFTVRLRAGRLPGRQEGAADAAPFGAGTPYGASPSRGTVHAIDGDGTVVVRQIGAAVLVRVDGLPWSDVLLDQRCGACQLLMDLCRPG